MKAVQISVYGGVNVIELNVNAAQPTPRQRQMLVGVRAASINPIDWKIPAS